MRLIAKKPGPELSKKERIGEGLSPTSPCKHGRCEKRPCPEVGRAAVIPSTCSLASAIINQKI